MLTALLSFGVPLLLSHLGVSLGAPALAGLFGARAATAAGSAGAKLAAAGVKRIIEHIAAGRDVTPEQRAWLDANRQELYLPPKCDPDASAGPDLYTAPRT